MTRQNQRVKMSNGDTIFSPATLGMAQRSARNFSGDINSRLNASDQQALTFLGGLESSFRRYALGRAAENKRHRSANFIAATTIAQKRFDLDLKRELAHFYTTDGRDVPPPNDYNKDLGFGVQIAAKDFISREGQRRTFVDLVDYMHSRFSESRKKLAPDVQTETRADLEMRKGKLQSSVTAQQYQDSRQGLILANNLNTIVRSYKESLATERGFNPSTFGLHMDSAMRATTGAAGLVDPGSAANAFRVALGDMLSVGVLEAAHNRDNSLALKLLANTELRDTRQLRETISGLSTSDQAYLSKMRKMAKGKILKYRMLDKPPKNKAEYFEWAIAQQTPERLAQIQDRALKAFSSQTTQVRAEVNERIKGIYAAAFSPMVKDFSFREGLKASGIQAMKDLNRVFPADLYPRDHSNLAAAIMVGQEAVAIRNTFDRVPTGQLQYVAEQRVGELVSTIRSKLPKGQEAHALPIQTKAAEALNKFAVREMKERQMNPYGSLQRIHKDIREIERRLSSDQEMPSFERTKLQSILRRRVKEESGKLQINPSFLSGNDLNTMTSMAKLGKKGELAEVVSEMRSKYGPVTFHDYIVPQIGGSKILGPLAMAAALVPDVEVSEMLVNAGIQSSKNLAILKKDTDINLTEMSKGLTDDVRGFDFWLGPDHFEPVRGYIHDRFGNGATGQMALTAIKKGANDLALSYLVAGTYGDAQDAVSAAIQTISKGIGDVMVFGDRETIKPPQNDLNGPRMELLGELLRDGNFLRQRVYPHINLGPFAENLKNVSNLNRDEVFDRWFLNSDALVWRQSFEGIHPTIPNPRIPDLESPVKTVDGSSFVIPYDELPAMIVKDY